MDIGFLCEKQRGFYWQVTASKGSFCNRRIRNEEKMKKAREHKKLRFLLMAIAGLAVLLLLSSCGASDVKEGNSAQDENSAAEPLASRQAEAAKPAETQAAQVVAAKTKADQKGQIYFNSPITTFVSQYNWYSEKGAASPLPEPGSWDIYSSENGIHTDCPVLNYTYSNEEAPDFYPTLQVSVSQDSGYIQEIAINYDDHDYREETYQAFENLCLYSLRSLPRLFFDERKKQKNRKFGT